jgi:hypothetical protein
VRIVVVLFFIVISAFAQPKAQYRVDYTDIDKLEFLSFKKRKQLLFYMNLCETRYKYCFKSAHLLANEVIAPVILQGIPLTKEQRHIFDGMIELTKKYYRKACRLYFKACVEKRKFRDFLIMINKE